MAEVIGWASSIILVLTIARQNWKQWKTQSVEGVSKYLFIGQLGASVGFTVYSWLVKNWVFVVTNSVMVLNALVGLGIVLYFRRKKGSPPAPQAATGARLPRHA